MQDPTFVYYVGHNNASIYTDISELPKTFNIGDSYMRVKVLPVIINDKQYTFESNVILDPIDTTISPYTIGKCTAHMLCSLHGHTLQLNISPSTPMQIPIGINDSVNAVMNQLNDLEDQMLDDLKDMAMVSNVMAVETPTTNFPEQSLN
jgi:hypothetical protein